MVTMQELCALASARRADPELSLVDLGVKAGVGPRLMEGLRLGVDPFKCKGTNWKGLVIAEIARAKAAREKDKAHNAAVSVAKGKPCDYVTPFPSDANLFTFRRVKEWHDMAHREAAMPASNAIAGLQAGRDMKTEFMHVMQDSLRSGEKWA